MRTHTVELRVLHIPVTMHVGRGRLSSLLMLRVGPFKTMEEARNWERIFVTASAISWPHHDEPEARTITEARTAHGPAVRELTGREKVEVSLAPEGATPFTPDLHYIIGGATVEKAGDEMEWGGLDIDTRAHTPLKAAEEFDYHVRQAIRRALDE